MGTVLNLINRVQSLDVNDVAVRALEETKEQFADANASQMFSGSRSDGTRILPDYKDITIVEKKRKGQPTDRVTLRDTGAFYQGIRMQAGTNIHVDSTDPKNDKLVSKYGEKIFGLGGQFKADYINEVLRPAFMRLVSNVLGLKSSDV